MLHLQLQVLRRAVLFSVAAVSVASRLAAQDGSLDTSFQSPQFAAPVPLIALEADGKVLYADAPDGVHFRIGRLTATGAAEDSIHLGDGPQSISPAIDFGTIHIPGATNPATINVVRPLPNGQMLVGGSFSHFNRVARKLLVRLNADGSVDSAFNQGPGFEGDRIDCVDIGPDGKIYAGGKITKFNGAARAVSIVRLNPDGSADMSFADSTISFGASIGQISLQPDGKVLVTAAYANSSFQATLQVFRLGMNGGLDATFSQGAGTPAVPVGLRHGLTASGQILLSGGSGLYNSTRVNADLFRLNADGTADASYAGLEVDLVNIHGLIGRFLPAPSGSIYVSGAFDRIAGQTLHGLARLRADGTLDPSFVAAAYVSPSPAALVLQPDGKLIVCASAISGTTPMWVIARLNGTAGTPAPVPKVAGLTLQPNGVVQLQVNGISGQVVVQSSTDLTSWSSLSTNDVVSGLVSFTDALFGRSNTRFFKLAVP